MINCWIDRLWPRASGPASKADAAILQLGRIASINMKQVAAIPAAGIAGRANSGIFGVGDHHRVGSKLASSSRRAAIHRSTNSLPLIGVSAGSASGWERCLRRDAVDPLVGADRVGAALVPSSNDFGQRGCSQVLAVRASLDVPAGPAVRPDFVPATLRLRTANADTGMPHRPGLANGHRRQAGHSIGRCPCCPRPRQPRFPSARCPRGRRPHACYSG